MVLFSFAAKAQKVDSIYFNLYTDSLKKGVHNYINIDGKLNNGSYLPLTSSEVVFSSSYGKWEGCSLIIDSAFNKDSVVITAKLKDRPEVLKTVTIYIKKVDEQAALKTEKELLEEWRNKAKKKA
ncbi:MAG: hypothetical protein JWQ96_1416 [Segetibacter sp.]|nr:hypothetical protein [Segetibacter sp.]